MEALKHKLLYGLLGATSGLSGLVSLARCSGGTCTSCFGCAGAGVGIALIVLMNRMKGRGGKNDGMA